MPKTLDSGYGIQSAAGDAGMLESDLHVDTDDSPLSKWGDVCYDTISDWGAHAAIGTHYVSIAFLDSMREDARLQLQAGIVVQFEFVDDVT